MTKSQSYKAFLTSLHLFIVYWLLNVAIAYFLIQENIKNKIDL